MASENSRKLKKLEEKIRSIRDRQKDFEQTYKLIQEYKTSRNEEKLANYQQKAEEMRENVLNFKQKHLN